MFVLQCFSENNSSATCDRMSISPGEHCFLSKVAIWDQSGSVAYNSSLLIGLIILALIIFLGYEMKRVFLFEQND